MKKQALQQGIKASAPVVLGYVPIGLAFGVLAIQAGLEVWQVFFMSLLVYAGSSQFIAAGLLAAGASFETIVITTFLVNSRHILLSASLAPHVKSFPAPVLAGMSFGVTDETYAVAMADLTRENKTPAYFFGLHLTSQFTWIMSTVLGAVVGNAIPDPQAFGLHFALPAMFIGLLVIQMRGCLSLVIAVVAAVLSLYIKLVVPGNWNVILATLMTATIGVILEGWMVNSSQSSSG